MSYQEHYDERTQIGKRESAPPPYESVVNNQPSYGFEQVHNNYSPTSPFEAVEILRNIDYFSIERSRSIRQAFRDGFTKERYRILDEQSKVLYDIIRKIKMEFICKQYTFECLDHNEKDVIHLQRNIYLRSMLTIDQDIKVILPPNHHLGTIEWVRRFAWKPNFVVKDAQGQLLYEIKGALDWSCCARMYFNILEKEQLIGRIGYKNIYETECRFPGNLTTVQKALLCGATMLIKDIVYEKR